MLLKRIYLEHFRQFERANVPFQRGLTAIVGPNGSGKTTLIEAIGFALYGEHRGLKKTVRPIHFAQAKPRVVLWFELGEKTYRVSRELGKAELVDEADDRILAATLSGVTQQVERILRLTYEQFTNSFCTEQKGLPFLQFRDRQRKIEELARMLGYDRLKTASRIAERGATAARGRREGARQSAERLPAVQMEFESAKREFSVASEQLGAAEDAHQRHLAALEELEPRREGANETLALLDEVSRLEAKQGLLERSAREREQEKEEAEQRLAERKSLEQNARRYEELDTARRELQSLKEKADLQARLAADIEHLERQAQERQQRITGIGEVDVAAAEREAKESVRARSEAEAEVEAQRQAWNERRDSARHQVSALTERKAGLERELRQLASAVKDGVCPTCGQLLPGGRLPAQEEKEKSLEEVVEALAAAERIVAQVEVEPKELLAAMEILERAREREQRAVEALATVRTQASLLEEELAALGQLEAELAKKREELGEPVRFDAAAWTEVTAGLASLEADYRRFLATADAEERYAAASARLAESQREVALVRAEIEQRRKRLEDSGLDQAGAQEILKEYESRRREADRAAVQLEAATRRVADMRQRLATAEENLKAVEEALVEERSAAAEELLNKTLATAFDVLSRELTESIRPELEKLASEYLAALSRGRYTTLSLTEEFEPVLVDMHGEQAGTKKVISGGEHDIVMLSLRLALSELIREKTFQKFSLLILDEVFGSLDEDRRQSVMEQLRELGDMFEQVLVISHIEGINEAADRVIEVRYDPERHCSFVRGHDIAEGAMDLVAQ